MGYYIETTVSKGKVAWLVKHANGIIVPKATPTKDSIPVIVIDNGPFEAAGIAFNSDELLVFTRPHDPRPKTIVMVPREKVIELCPFVKDMLAW